MQKARIQQLPLTEAATDPPKAKELVKISEILDSNSSIYDLVLQDLGGPDDNEVGARAMTAEQVLRAAIIKQMDGYSYRQLAFHLVDSRSYSRFCRTGFGKSLGTSTLQRCIKAISDGTWEQINTILIKYAVSAGIEKGHKARVDCTVVESNVHAPYDSDLLFDAVRVLARVMKRLKIELPGLTFTFADNYRRAKKRNLGIINAQNSLERNKLYRNLIMVTEKSIRYGEQCLQAFKSFRASSLEEHALVGLTREQLVHFLPLARQVVCQARRRIFDDESVPALEKIVSIFEPHTGAFVLGQGGSQSCSDRAY